MKIILVVVVLGLGMGYWAFARFGKVIGIGKEESAPVVAVAAPVVQSVSGVRQDDSLPLVLWDYFRGIVEDHRGRVIITDSETYIVGQLCSIGKVLQCRDDLIMIAGFDGRPHMIKKKRYVASDYSPSPVVLDRTMRKDSLSESAPGNVSEVESSAPEAASFSDSRSFDISGGALTVLNH